MADIQALKEKIKNLKVIFVDDEEQIRASTGLFLKKFFDDVTICNDGQDGIDSFTEVFNSDQNNFDIVIADIQMPKLNGIDMVKQMLDLDKELYVIFITATRGDIPDDELKDRLSIKKPISYNNVIEIMETINRDFTK